MTLFRESAYRYSSNDLLAFDSTSTVSGDQRQTVFTSAQLAELTTDLFLTGQEAVTVSRAALGTDAGISGGTSMSIDAGRYMFYSQSESRNFTSSGTIKLDNGEQVDFTLALRQSQSQTYEYSELVQIRERRLTDPLVVNFGSTTAQLTDALFEFDLNSDGTTTPFATLGAGSGYLVLDRNGNGKVDDGSELFGPQSGQGFAELARFDDDGNRWIDANDDIFSSLKVWVQAAEGEQDLRTLEEVGVKALYVDSVGGSFTLTNSQGVALGQIKGSGIYLTTGGEVRTLEELDLAEQEVDESEGGHPLSETVLSSNPGSNPRGRDTGVDEARVAAIRAALEKLNEIREQQRAFIEESKAAGKTESPLHEYLKLIDKLRLELLNSQDEKKQMASRYLEFAANPLA
ncbi:hypothetical protein [Marinobacter lipolyticus]|uniref:hypothetical protein n=1 Tax=Marinobacter lipolyticus TaxID=209639 RepID=UPI0003A20020|nr:hypothetical protein [Marinobacter lipolyticus]